MSGWSTEFALVGTGGEPVDLWRTIMSHGVVDLPPMRIDEERRALEATLALARGRPRTVEIAAGRPGYGLVSARGPEPSSAEAAELLAATRHVLRLNEDLSEFYAVAAADSALAWAATGAGRMVRSQTVFEEVVKTICTQRGTDPGSRRRPSPDRKSRFYSDASYTASGSTFREALTRPA